MERVGIPIAEREPGELKTGGGRISEHGSGAPGAKGGRAAVERAACSRVKGFKARLRPQDG